MVQFFDSGHKSLEISALSLQTLFHAYRKWQEAGSLLHMGQDSLHTASTSLVSPGGGIGAVIFLHPSQHCLSFPEAHWEMWVKMRYLMFTWK